jgi:hypothetical protein
LKNILYLIGKYPIYLKKFDTQTSNHKKEHHPLKDFTFFKTYFNSQALDSQTIATINLHF